MRPFKVFVGFELREITEELFTLRQGAVVYFEFAGKVVIERPDGAGRHLVGIQINVDPAADGPIGKDFLALQELFNLFETALHFLADVGDELAITSSCGRRLGHQKVSFTCFFGPL